VCIVRTCRFFGFCEKDGDFMMVMEFAEGGSLFEVRICEALTLTLTHTLVLVSVCLCGWVVGA